MSAGAAPAKLDRREFVAALLGACPEALVITGLGSPAYDAFAAGDRDRTFYLWGAMGGAAAMGLGLALAQPERSVLVLTGDGEQLMGLGALATIGVQRPANLAVVVLDNGHFGETGMQASHTGHGVSLARAALACGLRWGEEITAMDAVPGLARRIAARDGCGLAQVLVRADELPRALPARDGAYLKNRFRAALGLDPA
jgi:thiamine pyrophosphate-dependent acetolactate synthase large subunit-like protein